MAYTTKARADSLLDFHKVFRWCRLWRLTRVDGTIYYITDHDKTIVWNLNSYLPSGGFDGSAREFRAAQAENNFSVIGILSSDLITTSDLHGGLFEEAKIEEYIVDWKYPLTDTIRKDVWWISRIKWTNSGWNAELEGPKRFQRRRAGGSLSHLCRNDLGQSTCGNGVNIESASYKKAMTVITDATDRRTFLTFGLVIPVETTFDNGRVLWLTGLNAGIVSEIKVYTRATQILELEVPTPFDILSSDTATVYAGCDKLEATCKAIFNNFLNFRGRPHIQGTDSILPIDV